VLLGERREELPGTPDADRVPLTLVPLERVLCRASGLGIASGEVEDLRPVECDVGLVNEEVGGRSQCLGLPGEPERLGQITPSGRDDRADAHALEPCAEIRVAPRVDQQLLGVPVPAELEQDTREVGSDLPDEHPVALFDECAKQLPERPLGGGWPVFEPGDVDVDPDEFRQRPPLPHLVDDRPARRRIGPRLVASAERGVDQGPSTKRGRLDRSFAGERAKESVRPLERLGQGGRAVHEREHHAAQAAADPAQITHLERRVERLRGELERPGPVASPLLDVSEPGERRGHELPRPMLAVGMDRLLSERARSLDVQFVWDIEDRGNPQDRARPNLVHGVAGRRRGLDESLDDRSRFVDLGYVVEGGAQAIEHLELHPVALGELGRRPEELDGCPGVLAVEGSYSGRAQRLRGAEAELAVLRQAELGPIPVRPLEVVADDLLLLDDPVPGDRLEPVGEGGVKPGPLALGDRVVVDNTAPIGPAPGGRPGITIRQGDRTLDCCETVKRENGPLTITVEATDDNFSELAVSLKGGCGVGVSIFYKAYNGNLADTGAPAPGIDIVWDPWAAGVDPCCYVVFVDIYDRAIVNNSYSGRHANSNWHSITIA
jgi:hypothetical protein